MRRGSEELILLNRLWQNASTKQMETLADAELFLLLRSFIENRAYLPFLDCRNLVRRERSSTLSANFLYSPYGVVPDFPITLGTLEFVYFVLLFLGTL